jgi:hypothetical protein
MESMYCSPPSSSGAATVAPRNRQLHVQQSGQRGRSRGFSQHDSSDGESGIEAAVDGLPCAQIALSVARMAVNGAQGVRGRFRAREGAKVPAS